MLVSITYVDCTQGKVFVRGIGYHRGSLVYNTVPAVNKLAHIDYDTPVEKPRLLRYTVDFFCDVVDVSGLDVSFASSALVFCRNHAESFPPSVS